MNVIRSTSNGGLSPNNRTNAIIDVYPNPRPSKIRNPRKPRLSYCAYPLINVYAPVSHVSRNAARVVRDQPQDNQPPLTRIPHRRRVHG